MIAKEFRDWGIEGFEDCDKKSPTDKNFKSFLNSGIP
jgi:hypothetical protein